MSGISYPESLVLQLLERGCGCRQGKQIEHPDPCSTHAQTEQFESCFIGSLKLHKMLAGHILLSSPHFQLLLCSQDQWHRDPNIACPCCTHTLY